MAKKTSPEPCDAYFVAIQHYKSIRDKRFQMREFRAEIIVEINSEFVGDFRFTNQRVAQQSINYRAAQHVIIIQMISAHRCESAAINCGAVTGHIAKSLSIRAAYCADGADAHAV